MRRRGLQGSSNGIKIEFEYDSFRFDVIEDGRFLFTNDIYYCPNQIAWYLLPANTYTPTLAAGTKVYWKGELTPSSSDGIGTFSSTGEFNVAGNPSYLLKNNTLVDYAFRNLFLNCEHLIDSSSLILPEDIPYTSCYENMFCGCKHLINTPKLEFDNIGKSSCNTMFKGCESLTYVSLKIRSISPPGAFGRAQRMFENCTNLSNIAFDNRIKSLGTFIWYANMFNNVSPTGVYYYNMKYGVAGPSNWSMRSLWFGFKVSTASRFKFTKHLEYSLDGDVWKPLPANTYTDEYAAGEYIYFRGDLTPLAGIGKFSSTGEFDVVGDPRYLLLTRKVSMACFYSLLANSRVVNASGLDLPSETLYSQCYSRMFENCNSLTVAPKLPATTLASSCYEHMFNGCSALTQAPELPATTLAGSCYYYMFSGCNSLTQAPELPATTLASGCYVGMFQRCTSLTQAPELPATILTNRCYWSMFYGCNKLNYVKSHATDISAQDCLAGWLTDASNTGEFHKPANVTYPEGASGIPSGWNVHEI